MSVSTAPLYCPICKTYLRTTDICHCTTEDDIKYFKESLAKALGIDLKKLQEKAEK